ncbi:MAG: rhomboid family intramembrane serine protease [Bacteroidota bacterium]
MVLNEHNNTPQDNNINQEIFIIAAFKAIVALQWEILYTGKEGFVAQTDTNNWIKIVWDGGNISVTTEHADGQAIVERLKEAFLSAMASINTETVHADYDLISQSFQDEDIASNNPGKKKLAYTIAAFFIPVKNFFITPLIIDINILVYIIMICTGINFFEPDAQSMLAWGANYKPLTLDGQIWRLFTSCFLHFGILHLLLNMYALAYIGMLLEPLMGKSRYLSAYLFSGIIASAVSLWHNDFVVSAGASGAIFGMYGVFLAMMAGNIVHKSLQKELFANIGFFVVLNLVIGFSQTGIDNSAHIGGLVSGFVIGLIMVPGLKNKKSTRLYWGGIAISATLCAALAFGAYNFSYNDLAKYDSLINTFSQNEHKAVELYKVDENTTEAEVKIILETNIIPVWAENVKIADSLQALNVPETVDKQRKLIKEYSGYKLEYFKLLHKKVNENTEAYDQRIEKIGNNIEQSLNELNATALKEEDKKP